MTDGLFDVGLPISYGAKGQHPFVPVDRTAIPSAAGGRQSDLDGRTPRYFGAALSTRNSNAGIACAKGTPVCPERMAMAVKKKSRLRLMSNFHLHCHGHWIAITESEAKVIWTHSISPMGRDGFTRHWDDMHSRSQRSGEMSHTGSMGQTLPHGW